MDSLVKSGDNPGLIKIMPGLILELEKNKLERHLILAHFHYANALVRTNEIVRADYHYGVASAKAKSENLTDNYIEITSSRIATIFNALRSKNEQSTEAEIGILSNLARSAIEIDNFNYYKQIQILRIEIERKRGRNTTASGIANEFLQLLNEKHPDDTELISKLNMLIAELELKSGKKEITGESQLTPGQYAQLIIHQALEYEKDGDLAKSYQTLNQISAEKIVTLDWVLISDISKKRFELADKLNRIEEEIKSLFSLRATLLNDSTSLDPSKLDFLKLIIMGSIQTGNIEAAYNEITFIEKAIASGKVGTEFYAHFFRLRGDIAYLQGDYEDAIQYYLKLEAEKERLKPKEYFSALNNLGLSYYQISKNQESINIFGRIFNEANSEEFAPFRIQADINAGIVFLNDEYLSEALEKFKRANSEAQKHNLLPLSLISGIRMAEVYFNQGFSDFAADKFREVKKFVNDIKDPQEKTNLLMAIGLYERNLCNYNQAMIYLNQAYTLASRINLKSLIRRLAGELGDTYLISGKASEAKQYYDSILPSVRASNDLNDLTLLNIKISKCYYVMGDYKQASDILIAALNYLKVNQKDYLEINGNDVTDIYLYIMCLTELASTNFSSGLIKNDTRQVFRAYREATKATELSNAYFITQLSSSTEEDNSMKYLETYRLLVDIAINLFLQTGDNKYLFQAFDASEQSRARTFISDVGSGLLNKMNDSELKEVSLLSKQADERISKPTKNLAKISTTSLRQEGEKRGLKVIKDTTKSIIKIQNKYDEILTGLKKNKNKAAELVSISTLNLPAVQKLINDDQIILNYFVSKESIYLFCISSDTVSVSFINIREAELQNGIQEFRKHIQNPQSNEYVNYSSSLYRKLLSPVAGLITGKKLIIIPSGQLNNLPFSSLMNEGKFLIENHIITVLPNLSSLQFFKAKQPLNASSGLVAIGNPINDYTSPLPGAEMEVQAIQSVFKNNRTFLREKADETVIKQELPKGEMIHIACHGLFNYDYPLLSCLALAGTGKDDGRLELHEIYNLNLNRTSLVVLSACETALSQIKENDDMIGLVRGFLYSGVSSVIASLWKVDDVGTFELMVKFYKNLAAGNSKGLALQNAQVDLINSGTYSHPFFWSAFVLNGLE